MSDANADRNCIRDIREARQLEECKKAAVEHKKHQDERKARRGACQSCGALWSAGEKCQTAFGPG